MSFRNTFVTDFIYQGGEEVKDANAKVTAVFKEYGIRLNSEVGESGLGYYAGIVKTYSLGCELEELGLEPLVRELEKATKVPFRLTVMQESGAIITYNVEPR